MGDLLETTDINFLCIVCLTRSHQIIGLTDFLEAKETLQIKEVLEVVMCTKIPNTYPSCICLMCLRQLKISFELKQQFEKSSKLLKTYFKEDVDHLGLEDFSSKQSTSVEIIVGSNKYNLNDILIVEDVNEKKNDYSCFLDNLGKSITATFVKKLDKSSPPTCTDDREAHVSIEKISKNYETLGTINSKFSFSQENKSPQVLSKDSHIILTDDVDKYILLDGDYEEPIYIEKENFVSLFDIEKYIITTDTSIKDKCYNSKTDETPCINIPTNDNLIHCASYMQYKCNNCQKIYSLKGRYLNHIKICKKNLPIEQMDLMEIQLSCPMCTRKFKQKKFLNFHIKTVHQTPFYKCEVCNMILNNRNRYLYHKLTKHSEPKYICDVCGKKFLTSSSLRTHSFNHNKKITQCVCPVCGKTFHYKSGLFYHMKIHTNERKYFCTYCDRKFYTHTAKKRHTLTHTGDRPYPCQFCEKHFFSMGEVRKHEYIHTGQKPLHCDYCNKGFTSKFNLKVHLFSHAGSYKCTNCERGFITEDILKFHFKMKHKNLSVVNVGL